MKRSRHALPSMLAAAGCAFAMVYQTTADAFTSEPIIASDVVFAEKNGLVVVEAEHFFRQSATEKRAFHITTSAHSPVVKPDGDPPHIEGASAGGYAEILPDTRRTHDDKLIQGENFSPRWPFRDAGFHRGARTFPEPWRVATDT